jgi:hypothetical protein
MSEIVVVGPVATAQAAPQRKFLAIRRVVYAKRTRVFAFAGFCLVAASLHVTGITVVCVAMTEPECDGAAIAALKINVIGSVLFVCAFSDACSPSDIRTR